MARRLVRFNDLPAGVRERLARSLRDGEPVAPILQVAVRLRPPIPVKALGWIVAGGAGLLAVMLVASGIPTVTRLVVMAAAAAGLVAGAVMLLRARLAPGRLPFPSGRYLLPLDHVEATGPTLSITPTSEILACECHDLITQWQQYLATAIRVRFGDGESMFLHGDAQGARDKVALREEARQRAQTAPDRRDTVQLSQLDPFAEVRDRERWESGTPEPGGPRVRAMPLLLHPVLAGVLGAALGGGGWWLLREHRDQAAWEEAVAIDDPSSYQYYLFVGGRNHADDAHAAIPRAALRLAREADAVPAYRGFLDEYPDAPAELRDQASAAMHALFARSLDGFRTQASREDPRLVPFFERMLAHTEAAGPTVEVRFAKQSADQLGAIDAALQEMVAAEGYELAPVARHFGERSTSLEDAVVDNLRSGFQRVFDADIFNLTRGTDIDADTDAERKADDAPPAPAAKPATVPTITIEYTFGWSGQLFTGTDGGRRAYVGVEVRFDVSMTIPGDPAPFDFWLRVEPPGEFVVNYESSSLGNFGLPSSLDEPSDTQVYDTMALRAFDQLAARLESTLFRPTLSVDVVPDLGPIAPEELAGTYQVSGRNPRGRRADGTVTIEALTRRLYQVSWKHGKEQIDGIGIWREPVLAVAWSQDDTPSVAVYTREEDRLRGTYASAEQAGRLGYEGGTLAAAGADPLVGDWPVTGRPPDELDEYQGTLAIATGRQGGYLVTRHLPGDDDDGDDDDDDGAGGGEDVTPGIGELHGELLLVAYGTAPELGLTVFERAADGTLTGTSHQRGQRGTGSETLTRTAPPR